MPAGKLQSLIFRNLRYGPEPHLARRPLTGDASGFLRRHCAEFKRAGGLQQTPHPLRQSFQKLRRHTRGIGQALRRQHLSIRT